MLAVALADTVREARAPAAAELSVGANAVAANARDIAIELHAYLVVEAGSTLIARILDALLRDRVLVVAIIAVLTIDTLVAFGAKAFSVVYITLCDTGAFNGAAFGVNAGGTV